MLDPELIEGLNRKQRRMLMSHVKRASRKDKEKRHATSIETRPTDSQHQSLPEGIPEQRVGETQPEPSTEAGGEISQG